MLFYLHNIYLNLMIKMLIKLIKVDKSKDFFSYTRYVLSNYIYDCIHIKEWDEAHIEASSVREIKQDIANKRKNKREYIQALFVGVNSALAGVTLIPVLRWIITGDRTFIVPFPDFFTQDFIYPIVLIWSNYVGIYGIFVTTSIILMTSILITTISVEFYSLGDGINSIQYMIEDEIESELQALIDEHQKIFQLVQDLSDIFSETFFVRFIVSAALIGLLLFQLQTTENIFDNSIFFIYTFFELCQVFLQCYFGQFLIDASEKIADEVYNCGWENWQRIALKKKLITVLQRAQKPAVLKIWKFGVISMGQFTRNNHWKFH
ncbi:odorant receptor 4-like [Chironomus tepperi]|uniref:odorant receptor 4-like n=1 Tax=Chironomus tepperi TaxID=113505 RepID=UPI00391F4F20